MKKIMVKLSEALCDRIWLNKQIEIDGYTVDGFTVDHLQPITGKRIEVVFFKYQRPEGYEHILCECDLPREVRERGYIKVIGKNKMMQFNKGVVCVSVNGIKYPIGNYEEI